MLSLCSALGRGQGAHPYIQLLVGRQDHGIALRRIVRAGLPGGGLAWASYSLL